MSIALAVANLHQLILDIGAYAGIAAVLGIGVLSALYFSQARDVKRLREWAGRAPERAAEEEARIAAQAQAAQSEAQQQRAAAAASGGAATVAAPAVRPQSPAYSDISLAVQDALHPPCGIDPQGAIKTLGDNLKKAKEGKLF